ncbi:MAG: hypothetical protein WCL06_11925 [Bacteroidota bacterium]
MKKFRLIFFLAITTGICSFSSCRQTSFSGSQDCANYNYSDCNTAEPFLVGLNIRLTINDENLKVPITIFEGKVEEQLIVLNDTVSVSKYSVLLPADKYYSVRARYKKGNQIIYAFGGDNIRAIRTTVCDSSCWSTEDGNVNIELKN